MNTRLLNSWLHVCENLPGFANLFYDRLFSTNPSLRELFRNIDASAQDRHLRVTLGALANGQVSTSRLIALGRRYAGHGIRPAHYGVIVQTVLWALEQHLGRSWTPAVQSAWDDTLTRAAAVMEASDRRARHSGLLGEKRIPYPTTRLREPQFSR